MSHFSYLTSHSSLPLPLCPELCAFPNSSYLNLSLNLNLNLKSPLRLFPDLYRNIEYDLASHRHILRNLSYLVDLLQPFRLDLEKNHEIKPDNTFFNRCLMAFSRTDSRYIRLLSIDGVAFQNSGEAWENRSSIF